MTKRRRPAPPQDRPTPQQSSTAPNSTRPHRPEDGYAAPTAEDRYEARLLAQVHALGYVVSVRCRVCNHPLTAPKSVALHIGPRCARNFRGAAKLIRDAVAGVFTVDREKGPDVDLFIGSGKKVGGRGRRTRGL
jgi:hypothetical protein